MSTSQRITELDEMIATYILERNNVFPPSAQESAELRNGYQVVTPKHPNWSVDLSDVDTINMYDNDRLNGKLSYDTNSGSFSVMNADDQKLAEITLRLDADKNPIGLSINGKIYQLKDIGANEKGNLDDNAVQYSTTAENLGNLI